MTENTWPPLAEDVSHELVEQDSALCWFCGSYQTFYSVGRSIGEMVYSSNMNLSRERANGEIDEILDVHFESLRTKSKLCFKCLRQFLSELGSPDKLYVESQLKNEYQQFIEVIDVDTFLTHWNQNKYPFGCWISDFSDIDIKVKYQSLTIGELYSRGLRFSGELWFDPLEANQLINRYSDHSDEIPSPPEGFVDHINSIFHVDDKHFAIGLADVKAKVYDISIWEIQKFYNLE